MIHGKTESRKESYLYTHTRPYKGALSGNTVAVHAYCRHARHHPIKDIGVGFFGYSQRY